MTSAADLSKLAKKASTAEMQAGTETEVRAMAPSDVSTAITSLALSDPTLGTLTKTFVTNEQATITLSSAPTGQPVVSVSKEVPQVGVSNNQWDVNSTTENYTRTNSAPATTLDFEGFRLDGIALDSTFDYRFAPSGGFPDNVDCIAFNADGTKYYAGKSSTIYERSLSTPYDISTQSGSTSATGFVGVEAIDFNPTGTKMFTLQYGSTIREYTLSTAFDITSATATGSTLSMSADNQMADMVLGDDGSSIFTIGGLNDQVYRYSLSTPYDLSTAAINPISTYQFGSVVENTPNGLEFSNDGRVMLLVGSTADTIFEYELSTAWDITTASQKAGFPISSQTGAPENLAANADGSKFYVIGAQNVYTYTVPYVQAVLGTGSFASADVGKTIEANGGTFALAGTDGSFVETTAPTSYNQVASGNWEMYAVVYNTTDGDLELSGAIASSYDLTIASYVQSFSVASQENVPTGIAFKNDGTKMFVIGTAGDDINEYNLSAPWDISTASFGQVSANLSGEDSAFESMAFNTDGTKVFLTGQAGDDVNEFTLSTAWDVSTLSFSQKFSVQSQSTDTKGLAFKTDGTIMYVADDQTNTIYQYTLTTGFDVSTASYASKSFSVNSQETSPTGIAFNADGTKMFVIGATGDDVNEYSLSTAWDVSTASIVRIFSVSSEDTFPYDLVFGNYGTKLYMLGASNKAVYEYDVGSLVAPSGYHAVHTTDSTDSQYWTDINSMTVDEAAGAGNIYYAVSTDDRTTWSVIDDTDGVRDIVRNNLGTWEYNSNTTYGSETWTAGTTNTELATLEEAMEGASFLGTGYVLDNSPSYDSSSFSVTSQDTTPVGLAFNSDGTKMFMLGGANDTVYEYDLSTGYDLSTASYSSTSFSVAAQDTLCKDLAFNNDGTKMYVVGNSNDAIYQYDLSTGFDLSTASFFNSFSTASQETTPEALAFNADGTKMFVSGNTGDDVNEYSLSTAFNITTASFTTNFSVASEDATPRDMAFNADGTKMFILGGSTDTVYQYNLTTGFNISTASYASVSFSVTSQDTDPYAMAFGGSILGTKMYVLGNTNDTVYQYSTVGLAYTNQMNKTQLEAVTDPNHYTLGNDLDLAIIFNQTASGIAPASDGVSINYDANTLQKGAINGTDYEWDYPASDKVRITALNPGNYKVRIV